MTLRRSFGARIEGSPFSEPAEPTDQAFVEPQQASAGDLQVEVLQLSLSDRRARRPGARRSSSVGFAGDRAALVAALRRGDEGAAAALFHEYAPLVERTIGRVLGVDDDLPDAAQDVFLRALRSVHRLRDPQALTDWLLQITVCTATDWIRKRKRRSWLTLLDPREVEKPPSCSLDDVARDALRATYRVLDRLPVEERTAFALRHVDGMELTQLATACGCSLSTVKRRLQRAQVRFTALAKREPSLAPWVAHLKVAPEPAEDERS